MSGETIDRSGPIHPHRKHIQLDAKTYALPPQERLQDTALPARPGSNTKLEDVRKFSGEPFKIPRDHKRYVPVSVTGWAIDPESYSGHSSAPPTDSWSVLDSLNAWLEVADFAPPLLNRERRARELADKLNREWDFAS